MYIWLTFLYLFQKSIVLLPYESPKFSLQFYGLEYVFVAVPQRAVDLDSPIIELSMTAEEVEALEIVDMEIGQVAVIESAASCRTEVGSTTKITAMPYTMTKDRRELLLKNVRSGMYGGMTLSEANELYLLM